MSAAESESTGGGQAMRDAEQRLIAYVALLVSGMAVVGWYAWLVTSAGSAFVADLFILGSIAMAVLSIVLGPLAALIYDRRERDWAVHARHVTLALVSGTVAATVYLLVWGADAPIVVAGTVAALVAFWAVVPLAIGAISSTTRRRSMHGVLIAWPAANVLALILFAAPAPGGRIDFDRYNVLFLDDPYRTLGLLAIAGIVTLGPTLVGRVVHGLIRQRDRDEPTSGDQ